MSAKRINEFWAAEDKVSELYEFLVQIQNYIRKSEGCLDCRILQDTEIAEKFVVLEQWESKENHKTSLELFPQGLIKTAGDLFGKPPIGYFFKTEN
jgi:quinol monooxygenase YgiN